MRKVLRVLAGGALAVILSAPAAHAARPAGRAGERPHSAHAQRHDRDRHQQDHDDRDERDWHDRDEERWNRDYGPRLTVVADSWPAPGPG
jgi:hypothetical protein